MGFSDILERLQAQPESYSKKAQYKFGQTLGAGTYGVVREAVGPTGKVAIKIILKKTIKGHENMVYEELKILQKLHHPHIIKFVDWFEARDKFFIVTQLATGGEVFERIYKQGKFTEKDASQLIRQVLDAVNYLHQNKIVHRDLKPENLLFVTKDPDSPVVVADFGIAKTLDWQDGPLHTLVGSFGYTAPEILNRSGHGKPADMWSIGVITYTLLSGYSPFQSDNLPDLLEECLSGSVIFHERYWKDVSDDAKDFIMNLIVPEPHKRLTSEQALEHTWVSGLTASEHDLLPDISRAMEARAKLKHAILAVTLKKRIAALKEAESDSDDMGDAEDGVPSSGVERRDGAVFREVVLGAVRDKRAKDDLAAAGEQELEEARSRSRSRGRT
ncbi:unnamed protein product [Clonostachys byssicola]|uniref:calcium/calmodulin-dependent protein kinase n=1 Tax=Clonostachys byssicola TaxID=160290 RepID=A0A9N9U9P7_9HYPO|nr:unnamed protein product [Clonostachys byssicola]